jgi:pyridoxine 4-dehydrogenase
LRELGIGLTAYGVLSRGFISGHWSKAREGDGDFRSINPRFQGENLDNNLQLVEKLREQARAKGVTVAQLAIAWALAKGKDIVPLVGARKRDRLDESLGALDLELGPSDVEQIERIVPPAAVAGTRYHEYLIGQLDSERAETLSHR